MITHEEVKKAALDAIAAHDKFYLETSSDMSDDQRIIDEMQTYQRLRNAYIRYEQAPVWRKEALLEPLAERIAELNDYHYVV